MSDLTSETVAATFMRYARARAEESQLAGVPEHAARYNRLVCRAVEPFEVVTEDGNDGSSTGLVELVMDQVSRDLAIDTEVRHLSGGVDEVKWWPAA